MFSTNGIKHIIILTSYVLLILELFIIVIDIIIGALFFVSIADLEFEQLQTKRSDRTDDISSLADRMMMFESPSCSEEDNPLIWDPVVEACNKHVTLSQVDSGNILKPFIPSHGIRTIQLLKLFSGSSNQEKSIETFEKPNSQLYNFTIFLTCLQVKVLWIIKGILIIL